MYKQLLEIYSINITKARSRPEERVPIYDIGIASVDGFQVMEVLVDSLSQKEEFEVDETNKKTLRIDKKNNFIINPLNRFIKCFIQAGTYGLHSNFYDINTNEHVFTRTGDNAEELPFYFHVQIPEGSGKGYLVLQRMGSFGIAQIMTDRIKKAFRDACPDHVATLNPLVDKKLFKEYIETGILNNIVLERNSLPSDLAEQYNIIPGMNKIVSTVQVKINFKPSNKLEEIIKDIDIKEFIENPLSSYFEIQDLGNLGITAENSTTKVVMSKNNQKRTFNLDNVGKVKPYYDITNELRYDVNGMPTFNSIAKLAENILLDFDVS